MLTSHEIEDILDRFRVWLAETNEELSTPDIIALHEQLAGGQDPDLADTAGLLQLAETFTALRQEVKLHTKGVRGLQEDVQTSLGRIDQAVDGLNTSRSDAREAATRAARPLVETLLDLDEAISQAVAALDNDVSDAALSPKTSESLLSELDLEFARLPAWRRAASRFWHQRVRDRLQNNHAARSQMSQQVREGLRMLNSRLARSLVEAGVERIQCVGQRVDPNLMQVVDVVDDVSGKPETVVAEVRPGYLWRGEVLRHAEVRATKA